MPLTKQVVFRVVTRTDTFNGVSVGTEVILIEDDPQPDAAPIQITLRQLGDADARQFLAGTRVTIIVGADPAPAKIATVPEVAQSVLDKVVSFFVGNEPDPSQPN